MTNDSKRVHVQDVTPSEIPAGEFSSWLARTRNAQMNEKGAAVPCGTCIACCTSAYFIHIAPDEKRTLHRIPPALLVKAPGMPKGNVVMGFDENGCCPMLIDRRCSIYDDRPQACRNYDCRVFPAAGIPAGEDKELINQRVRSWQFSYSGEQDHKEHAAVRAAATFLRDNAPWFPRGFVPSNATQLAMLAIDVYEVFVDWLERADRGEPAADRDVIDAVVEKKKALDAARLQRRREG